jgi:hypothetical protein
VHDAWLNNAYMPGPMVIALVPDHGMMLKDSGYTKRMMQEHIHTYAYHEVRWSGTAPCSRTSEELRKPSSDACH